MTSKLKKLLRDESGITALETAIILIAFVVVASVFAFTILSAGTSSTEKSKEAIYAGIEQVEGSMEVMGGVIAKANAAITEVVTIEFTLSSVAGGTGIDMADTNNNNKVVIDYRDENQFSTNMDWTTEWLVCNEATCDDLLEEDEQVLISVSVSSLTTDLAEDMEFTLEIKPPTGGVIPIERRTPSVLSAVMNLN